MSGFAKIFGSILDSSIWDEPDHTRLVWITMLVMADGNGYIAAALPGLARRARVSIGACTRALETLSGPDKYDRSGVDEGRRIKPVQGGWQIVNHRRYRDLQSPGARRVAEHRKRVKEAERQAGKHALHCNDVTPEAEAEAEAVSPVVPFSGDPDRPGLFPEGSKVEPLPGEQRLGKRPRQALAKHREVALRLWALQDLLRREVGRKLGKPLRTLEPTAERLARVAERLEAGASEADCEHVLAVYAHEASKSRNQDWFNGSTNWREKPFGVALGRPHPGDAVVGTQAVSMADYEAWMDRHGKESR